MSDKQGYPAGSAELEKVRGAMRADDKRLEEAAIRVWGEHIWGCDTPDRMADTILGLRADLASEQERSKALAEVLREILGFFETLRQSK